MATTINDATRKKTRFYVPLSMKHYTSDIPLPPDELKIAQLLNFPTAISGVVPFVNLPNIQPGQLKLNGTVLADIFSTKNTN